MSSIHIKLEYFEAITMRKSILLFQERLITILGNIRSYYNLRKKELTIKNQIKRQLAELRTLVASIETHLPKEDVRETSRIYRAEKIKEETKNKSVFEDQKERISNRGQTDLEEQLEEIREKLARLG